MQQLSPIRLFFFLLLLLLALGQLQFGKINMNISLKICVCICIFCVNCIRCSTADSPTSLDKSINKDVILKLCCLKDITFFSKLDCCS